MCIYDNIVSVAQGYRNCYHPGWRLMRLGCRTCFHTLYDEKKYIHVCVCIYIYIYIYICVCVYIYVCVCIYVCVYVCVYI